MSLLSTWLGRKPKPAPEVLDAAARRYADWAAQAAAEGLAQAFEQLSGEPAPIPVLQGWEQGYRHCAYVSFRDGAEFERSGRLELD